MSTAPLDTHHPDHSSIAPLVSMILQSAGGRDAFVRDVPNLLRKAIDEVIDTPRTNRFLLRETEKTEKTYLGTKIEILLRAYLKFDKGKILDLSVGGVEVDIKNTMDRTWSIPREAVGHPCLLVKENEKTARCSVGIVIAKEAYLNPGNNGDRKRTFSAAALANVWWILRDHPYPANFWEGLPTKERNAIMAAGGGSRRVAALFETLQGQPIARAIVEGIGQQKDPLKRIRRGAGARDLLAPKGIAILWGKKDRSLIDELGLGPIQKTEFISFKPTTPAQQQLLKAARHID